MSDNGVMEDNSQAEINKIHIDWLVRNVQSVQDELQKQTYLIYTLLISIIGALIGVFTTI